MLGIETAKDYLLGALAIGFMAASVFGYVVKADNRALSAEVSPLKQAAQDSERHAEGYRTALVKCEGEKLAMKNANDKALGEAQAAQAAADKKADDYLYQLQHPGTDCAAITQVKVCPRLMGY